MLQFMYIGVYSPLFIVDLLFLPGSSLKHRTKPQGKKIKKNVLSTAQQRSARSIVSSEKVKLVKIHTQMVFKRSIKAHAAVS